VARRGDLLRSLQATLGSPSECLAADVSDPAAMNAAAAAFTARHGIPDIVIANAGISHGNLTEIAEDVETFRQTLEINVLGLVNTFHPFLAAMRDRGQGSLVGIASVAGFRGLPGGTAYSASKAAAIRYLEGLRIELRGTGVRVTTICPGYIATPMTRRNPYRMPFIIGPDDAARRFARAIDAGAGYAVIPWQMALVGRILGVLPNWLFDRLAARAGRKPRKPA
jgi:NAD(P)-dependent dehydrogenase (short-subunit alcohol dehydrogenase family)